MNKRKDNDRIPPVAWVLAAFYIALGWGVLHIGAIAGF